MAHFQLGHSRLFPGGTRLFANGVSGTEKLVIHNGNKILVELAGMQRSKAPPIVTVDRPGILDWSIPKKTDGEKWALTIQAIGKGMVKMSAVDSNGAKTSDLTFFAGEFKNHPGMEHDLIANVFRGTDSAKMYAIIKILGNAVENLLNENSTANVKQWGILACGTVSKVGGQKLFYNETDYDYQRYYKPIPATVIGTGAAARRTWVVSAREDIKYDKVTLEKGEKAIQEHLKAGRPVVTGITYIPSSSIQPGGSLKETGSGGHTVLIVGCDTAAKKFLYFDPYGPDGSGKAIYSGSILQYTGGPDTLNAFPDVCAYLGLLVEVADPARGGPVLRQDPSTQAPSGMFSGNQYLEVISGPLK